MSHQGMFAGQHTSSWQPPAAALQFQHGSGAQSAQTPWSISDSHYQHLHSTSQQWSAPAAAAAGGGGVSFNYGFGQIGSAQPPQPPAPPPYNNHASSSTMQPMGSVFSTQPAQQQQYQQQYQQPGHQGPGADPGAAGSDDLKLVKNLPAPFQPIFNFRYFNPVQSECFEVASASDANMVVSAPTGSGKTGVMELAILRLLSKHLTAPQAGPAQPMGVPRAQQQQFKPMHGSHKTIYLGPIKALVQERQMDWQARFGQALGLKVLQLTGDDDTDGLDEMEAADIICSTPEKFDQVTRKVAEKGSMGFFGEIGLVLLDEVHLLNESGRGSSLEAGCVCRIKAVAALPEMRDSHLASVRFVAVSATIPNIADIARWLSVPPAGLRQYGDELRPCKLTTHVKGYAPAKNDFLFERRLNDHVCGIVREYSKGRPALVFCSSRKGTIEAAAAIVKEAEAHAQVAAYSATAAAAGSTGSIFVRDRGQLQRLRAAAGNTQAKVLASVLVAGVGFHNAAMEPEDRALVEKLFKANDLAVLCTTSTLAMGVNLPAHLVVLKGTVRWVGDSEVLPGEQPGYKEYSQTEVLQMVGRAGRPQFDQEGVAVIMTSRDSTHRYQRLLAGQVVESCLLSTLPEHLNAEVVLGTVKDVSQAIAWIRSTFLFTRVSANPQHYGVKLKPGASEAELDAVLRDQIVLQPVKQLLKYQLVESDEDNYSLAATPAGKLMAANFLKLKTMAAIIELGERPNVPSLLRVICAAEEFKNTGLRRSEKKVLNEINHSKDPQQLRYHVMASKEGNKIKERINLPAEKLFLLLNDALADQPSEALDYSLRQEQTRLLVVGQRIAKCMAKFYALRGSFSSAGRSLLLMRSLKNRLWEDSGCSVRQLPSVGRQLGARLAAAGLGSLRAVAACGDAHRLEVAAQKPYPWGSELLASLKANSPPAIDISMQLLEPVRGGQAYSCQITVARQAPAAGGGAAQQMGVQGAWAASSAPAAADSLPSTSTPCKLLVGCSSTDELLVLRQVVLERMESPTQVTFKVSVPAGVSQPLTVTAMLLHEKLIGFDQRASNTLPPLRQQPSRHGPAAYNNSSSSRQTLSAGSDAAGLEEPLGEEQAAAPAAGGLGAWAEAPAAADAAQAQPVQNSQDAQASLDAAAEAYSVVRHKQQLRTKRGREAAASASHRRTEDAGSVGSRVPLAAADTSAAGQGLGSMLPPAKRSRGSRHAAGGAPSLQQDEVPQQQQQQQQQDTAEQPVPWQAEQPCPKELGTGPDSIPGMGAGALPGHQPAAAPLQSSIAARYRSIFCSAAAAAGGPPGKQQQQQPPGGGAESASAPAARCGPGIGGPDERSGLAAMGRHGVAGVGTSTAPRHGAAAMDSGELQVTPAGVDRASPSGGPSSAAAGHQQHKRQGAGGAGQAWHAMPSLFDMLADDDDDTEAPQQDHPSFSSHQQPRNTQRVPVQSKPLQPAGMSGMDGQAGLSSASTQQDWEPLAGLQRSAPVQAAEQGQGSQASRASARAHFGAAVHRSHQATSSLLSSLQRGSSQPKQQPVLDAAAPKRLQGGLQPKQHLEYARAGQSHVQQQHQQQQQLLTPPHQIKPIFSEPAADTRWTVSCSSHRSAGAGGRAGQQAPQRLTADWSADRPALTGRQQQPQGLRELPDLSRFAFTAGSAAPAAAVPPAAFKPSANAALFGHLTGTQPRSSAQGKLLSGPRPAASDAGQPAARGIGQRSAPGRDYRAQVQGQPGLSTGSSSLPGAVPWQHFVSERQPAPAGGGPGEAVLASAARQQPPGTSSSAQRGLQQRASSTKQARAAWQAGSAGQLGAGNTAAFGGISGAAVLGAGGAGWRASAALSAGNVFEELADPLVPAAPAPPPPGPAVAAAAGDDGPAFDIGGIFAFMK